MALLATGGQITMTRGYATYPASQASTMNLSLVPFAALLGMLFLDETANWIKILGLTVTLSSVALVTSAARASQERPGSPEPEPAPRE